jgi:hypothetical protein
VAAGTGSNAGLVSRCTSGRAHAGQKAEGNPKREGDGQRARAAHVGAWHARWVVCTRVDGYEDEDVVQVDGEEGDTLKKVRDHRAVAEKRVWDPGREEGSAVEPVDVGDSPDKAHGDQTLGFDEMDEAQCDDEWEAVGENDVQDGRHEGRVCDEPVAAVEVVVVEVEVEVDDEATVAVVPAAAAAAAVVVVVVAAAAAYA